MCNPKIGFIGIGLLGSDVVARLQDKKYTVNIAAHKSRENIEAAVARGAIEYDTPYSMTKASDIIMLCMDSSTTVERCMHGKNGVIAGLTPNNVVIDLGTSLPASTRALGVKVAEAGGHYLDAPLIQTPTPELDGDLNILASGTITAFEKVKPVLEDLGENVFHLGDLGSGHTIKLINNFFGMIVANALAEAFAMADRTNIERGKLHAVMAAGFLHSGIMDFVKSYAVDGDPNQLTFTIRNAAKDLGYYSQMAESTGANSFLSQGALSALQAATEAGKGEDTIIQLVDFFAAAVER